METLCPIKLSTPLLKPWQTLPFWLLMQVFPESDPMVVICYVASNSYIEVGGAMGASTLASDTRALNKTVYFLDLM